MKMKELLSSESKWTQQHYATDKRGRSCSSFDPEAVCYCLLGALNKCYVNDAEYDDAKRLLQKTIEKKYGLIFSIAKWNDNPERKFKEVKEILEEANL